MANRSEASKARRKETAKAWVKRNPERRAAIQAAYTAKNAERIKARNRLRARQKLGIVDATDEARTGECPICLNVRDLAMDHDHRTGLRRGWLCRSCNQALGALGDDAESLRRALVYVDTSAW